MKLCKLLNLSIFLKLWNISHDINRKKKIKLSIKKIECKWRIIFSLSTDRVCLFFFDFHNSFYITFVSTHSFARQYSINGQLAVLHICRKFQPRIAESIRRKFRDKVVYVNFLFRRNGFIYLDGAFRFQATSLPERVSDWHTLSRMIFRPIS